MTNRAIVPAGTVAVVIGSALGVSMACPAVRAADYPDYCDVEVRSVAPGAPSSSAAMTPPSDAIVLFNGSDLSQWRASRGGPAGWTVHDGIVTVAKSAGDIQTALEFGDIQLHIEWRVPTDVQGSGQIRANSGVFLQGRYELQVLDSFHNRTFAVGQAGSIFGQAEPLVNAMRAPGYWNVYDIIFNAPRFHDDGSLFAPAHVTVLHNGVLIQNQTEITGMTGSIGAPTYEPHGKGPIRLQAHGGDSAISYRNIWVRELYPLVPQSVQESTRPNAEPHIARRKGELSADSTIRELLANRATREVIERCVPEIAPPAENLEYISRTTLREMKMELPGISDSKLRIIEQELSLAQR